MRRIPTVLLTAHTENFVFLLVNMGVLIGFRHAGLPGVVQTLPTYLTTDLPACLPALYLPTYSPSCLPNYLPNCLSTTCPHAQTHAAMPGQASDETREQQLQDMTQASTQPQDEGTQQIQADNALLTLSCRNLLLYGSSPICDGLDQETTALKGISTKPCSI